MTTKREDLLDEAKRIITQQRNNSYGPPSQDFERTAKLWSVYLSGKLQMELTLEGHDIAALMVMLKLSRLTWNPGHEDNWLDIAGYAACGWECVADEDTIS